MWDSDSCLRDGVFRGRDLDNNSLYTSQVALMLKNLPASARDNRRGLHLWVGEVPLEKEMATHFSIPAWEIPWTEEPGRLQSMRLQRVEHDWARHTFTMSCKKPPQMEGRAGDLCSLIWARVKLLLHLNYRDGIITKDWWLRTLPVVGLLHLKTYSLIIEFLESEFHENAKFNKDSVSSGFVH